MYTKHLATAKWFYSHGAETLIIIAFVFTLIGIFFGYLLWRHYLHQSKRVHAQNIKLRDKISILETQQKKFSKLIQESR